MVDSALVVNLRLLILVFTSAANLLIGFIALKSNSKSITNRIFAVVSLFTAVELVFMHLSFNTLNPTWALFWVRLSIFMAVPHSVSFFLLAYVIPEQDKKISLTKKLIMIVPTLLVMALTLTPYVFSNVDVSGGSPRPQVGPAIPVFALFVSGMSLGAVTFLVSKVMTTTGVVKKQLGLVLAGLFSTLTLIIATIIVPYLALNINLFVPFFPLYILIFTVLTTYAIVKHNLFDSRIIATELLTILIWTILFSRLFISQSADDFVINSLILVVMIIFGMMLIRSITNEIEQRQELTKLAEKLKELDHRKDEFLNVVAHELRAPMTAIKGYVSMLLEGDAGELPDDAVEYLKVASKSTDRLIRLVNNLLNVSRIEEGRQVYQMGVVNLLSVVKSVFDEFKFNAEAKGLRFVLDMGSTPPPDSVYVDKDRIHEVVSNFISNAIKYTDTGSILVKVYNPTATLIRMEVSDTGKGIAPVDQQKLFQKYYRVESAVGRAVGTGLGLYISKLLVEKFGGRVGFVSQEGKGSNFWFELPLVGNTQKPNIMV